MTPLRQRRIEALQLRGLSERTQEMAVRAVRQLAEHDHTSPDPITQEERRDSFLSRQHVQHASRSASTIALCGITGFYAHTLKRDWTTLPFVRPPQAHTLPVILSLEDVHTRLPGVRLPRSRACLTTLDACGLRLQEGTHLQRPALAHARMLVHGRCGTGAKDRSVPLPPQTLEGLRQSWTTPRHPVWLCPAPGRRGVGRSTASTPMPRHSVPDAWRAALQASGLHTRASGHPGRHAGATHRLEAGVHLRLLQPSVGHHTPTTTALSTPLTVTADARARDALQERLAGLAWPREGCQARTRRELPARGTGGPRHMRRPSAPKPPEGPDGHRTGPDRGAGRACLPVYGVR